MAKLLYLSDIFEKSIYVVGKNEHLLSIALKVGVPPHFIIKDNNLFDEPKNGDVLIIKKRGEMRLLSFDDLQKMTEKDKGDLMLKNGVSFLFVGMLVI